MENKELYTVNELFQRVCDGETLNEVQKRELRNEFVFDKALSVVVIGSNVDIEKVMTSLSFISVGSISVYDKPFREYTKGLEEICPDIIIIDSSESYTLVHFMMIQKSDILKNAIVMVIKGKHLLSVLDAAYSLESNLIILSPELFANEIKKKLTDMLIYQKCCSLKGSYFDYRNCSVLHVDNSISNTLLIKILLKDRLDVEPVKASSDVETMEYVKNNKNTLLIADCRRDKTGGIRFMKTINTLYKHVPFVLLSSYDNLVDILSYSIGASDIIKKPLTIWEFTLKIRNQLRIQQCLEVYWRIMDIE